MKRWSIKGFSTPTGNYYGALSPQRFLNKSTRVGNLTDRKGRPLDAATEAEARKDLRTNPEPQRILVRFVDDSGRTHHAWVYLSDYATRWKDVDFDEVISDLEKQYVIGIRIIEKPRLKPPKTPKELVGQLPQLPDNPTVAMLLAGTTNKKSRQYKAAMRNLQRYKQGTRTPAQKMVRLFLDQLNDFYR